MQAAAQSVLHSIGGTKLLRPQSLLDDASSPMLLFVQERDTVKVEGVSRLRRVPRHLRAIDVEFLNRPLVFFHAFGKRAPGLANVAPGTAGAVESVDGAEHLRLLWTLPHQQGAQGTLGPHRGCNTDASKNSRQALGHSRNVGQGASPHLGVACPASRSVGQGSRDRPVVVAVRPQNTTKMPLLLREIGARSDALRSDSQSAGSIPNGTPNPLTI